MGFAFTALRTMPTARIFQRRRLDEGYKPFEALGPIPNQEVLPFNIHPGDSSTGPTMPLNGRAIATGSPGFGKPANLHMVLPWK